MMQEVDPKPKRAIVAAVQLSSVSDLEFDASLTELRQLAKTLGFEVVGRFTQKRARFDSAAYFGPGKREELRAMQDSADVILVDHEISPSQAFNLEKEVRSEEHTSELQSPCNLVCRLLLEKKKNKQHKRES